MDEVIFEEFKGTGNMQVLLDRRLSNRRVYPAVDVTATSTRKEELLLTEFELNRSWVLRRILNQMGVIEGMEFLQERMQGTESNEEFLKAHERLGSLFFERQASIFIDSVANFTAKKTEECKGAKRHASPVPNGYLSRH